MSWISYTKHKINIKINIKNKTKLIDCIKEKLNKNGNKNANSTSYKIKKIASNEKFKFSCKFSSLIDLNPHS